jgi:hypothetical protein
MELLAIPLSQRAGKWLVIPRITSHFAGVVCQLSRMASSSIRRESGKKNNPRSGQNLVFDLLCRKFLIIWIPACAGMTG